MPSHYADRLGVLYTNQVSNGHKKEHGQFFTPHIIAKFMASLASCTKSTLSVLDPGCGTAILSLCLIERIVLAENSVRHIELTVYETDLTVMPFLEKSISYMQTWLAAREVEFIYTIENKDFVLANTGCFQALFPVKSYDYIIANPPYFKLPKDDSRVKSTAFALLNQPNIYSIFLSIAAMLLSATGELIFIIPRSFTSGSYFKPFRLFIYDKLCFKFVHLFNSRREAFSRDNVLQETLILKAVKRTDLMDSYNITVSTSEGAQDLEIAKKKDYAIKTLIDFNTKEKIFHLPTHEDEERVLQLFHEWKHRLRDFGIQISTGPVVSFRLRKYLVADTASYPNSTVPLFWLHNVTKMSFEWPKPIEGKEQHIETNEDTNTWLSLNRNYVLLRRFSTKDDKSRLIACPYFSTLVKSPYIGIENKLNYIYGLNSELDEPVMLGLSALLNSSVFNIYFRTFNGNVNVSATELREMTFPPLRDIKSIGYKIKALGSTSDALINFIVAEYFNMELKNEKTDGCKKDIKSIGVA